MVRRNKGARLLQTASLYLSLPLAAAFPGLAALSLARVRFPGSRQEVRDLIPARPGEPFVALAGIVARPLIVELHVSDGLRHPQLLDERGKSVGGQLRRAPSLGVRRTRHQNPASNTSRCWRRTT